MTENTCKNNGNKEHKITERTHSVKKLNSIFDMMTYIPLVLFFLFLMVGCLELVLIAAANNICPQNQDLGSFQ